MALPAPKVVLTARQRAIVARLARSRSDEQRLVERAQIVLRSADDELCVVQARDMGVDAQRVRRWRKRFSQSYEVLQQVESASTDDRELEAKIREILSDEYRSGTPPTFTPEQVTTIIALACHEPSELDLPISHWTPDDLARQAVALNIVKSISGRHVDRFLKRSRLAPSSFALLAQPRH